MIVSKLWELSASCIFSVNAAEVCSSFGSGRSSAEPTKPGAEDASSANSRTTASSSASWPGSA